MTELGRYLQIARRGWWIVLPCFVLTTALTVMLVAQAPPTYESKATFVVRPRQLGADNVANAFAALVNNDEITATYAEIARSDAIKSRVETWLHRSMASAGVTFDADIVPGTQVITIVVHGPDPKTVQRFANEVALQTQSYIEDLQDTYQLVALQTPQVPTTPVGPNKVLTIGIGAVFGLFLGFAFASVWDYARRSSSARARPYAPSPAVGADIGADSIADRRSFALRARQELGRARLAGLPISFGLLRTSAGEVSNGHDAEHGNGRVERLLPELIDALRPTVRGQDVVDPVDSTTIGVILPGIRLDRAERLLSDWRGIVVTTPYSGADGRLSVWTGACEYRGDGFVGDRETRRQIAALLQRLPSEVASPSGSASVAEPEASSETGRATASAETLGERSVGNESSGGTGRKGRKGLSVGRRGTR
jgi:capsular polysaccharide biosynthesis protein